MVTYRASLKIKVSEKEFITVFAAIYAINI